jgi:hypothetical protein
MSKAVGPNPTGSELAEITRFVGDLHRLHTGTSEVLVTGTNSLPRAAVPELRWVTPDPAAQRSNPRYSSPTPAAHAKIAQVLVTSESIETAGSLIINLYIVQPPQSTSPTPAEIMSSCSTGVRPLGRFGSLSSIPSMPTKTANGTRGPRSLGPPGDAFDLSQRRLGDELDHLRLPPVRSEDQHVARIAVLVA